MNKKKIQAFIVAGLISTNTLAPLADTLVQVEENTKVGVETRVNSVIRAEKGYLYLSDIDYESGSSAGYGQIRKDTNVEGNSLIKLIVEGEVVEFNKGMAAHANSTLIYNVEAYKDTYSRLTSYVGVDASRGSNGNGVIFIISTSDDGVTWNEVKRTQVLKGDMESEYIDIPLNGANYVRLVANNNGNMSADHSVYGDLKLVKEDYVPPSTNIEGLETLASYDATLRAHDIDYNIEHNEMTILRRALVEKIGHGTLKRMAAQDQKYANAINYLINDNTALKYFMTGGPVSIHGSYLQSFKCFSDIYDIYESELKDSADDNFNLRLAISISLSHGYIALPTSWLDKKSSADAVGRYEVYQELISSGRMDEGGDTNTNGKWSSEKFKALPVAMMRWAVDNRMNNDEILWLADFALKQKAEGANYFDAYNYIKYTSGYNYNNSILYDPANFEKYNDKYGFDDYYDDYGNTNMNRLWMVFEEGAVCGGLAQTYSNLADTFGRPSSPCGQPGHAASLTYAWNSNNQRYEWIIQNNVSGWTQTNNQYNERMLGWGNQSWIHHHSASYTVLATDAVVDDYDNYVKATLLNFLANSYADDNETKRECYEKALEHQAINLDAMEGLINCYKADTNMTSNDYFELAKKVIKTYTYYPQTMMDVLALIENNITDPNYVAQIDMLKYEALIKSSNATPDVCSNVEMNKHLSAKYLGNESMELASFSFDGDNAGQIVMNEKYNGSSIRVRYSLDGGTNWKQTNDHIIELTDEELASITAENDIKVGLVGVDDVYTIDILNGNTITQSTIYANDNENLLLGNVENLEFSLDGGTTWCDYVTGVEGDSINPNGMDAIRIEGNQYVKVRYKAHGLYLPSAEVEYTFTENTDTEERKYIPLKYVNLVSCSNANSNNHKGEHLIDGTVNTGYHTPFRQTTNDKFYIVEFDKVRYINSIEYQSNGFNGKLKDGEIYTSLDGQNWTLSGTFTNLERNHTLKTLDLDSPTATKFIKIVATNTHGNSEAEKNMYLAGNMLNFYEDATIVEDEPTILPDDVPVQDVLPDDEDLDLDMNVKPDPVIPDGDFDSNMNVKPDPVIPDEDFDSNMNVKPDPVIPDEDFDSDMNVKPDPVIPDGDLDSDMNVKPDPVIPDEDLDSDMNVKPDPVVPDEDFDSDMNVTPEQPPVEEEEMPDTPDTEVPPTDEPEIEGPSKPDVENPDDEEVNPDTPEEEKPEFNHNVVELVSGNGQKDSPLLMIIKKSVMVNELNSFLTDLKKLNPILISKTIEGNYTVYELKLDRNSELLDKIFKRRNIDDRVYAIIKIENSRTELVSILNDFVKEPDSSVVVPETENPQVPGTNTESKPNNNETVEGEINSSINNISAGDVSTMGGYLLLGATSLLGALGLIKKRNKK